MEGNEMAFFKAHFSELPQAVLKQLNAAIVEERRRREAVTPAAAKGSTRETAGLIHLWQFGGTCLYGPSGRPLSGAGFPPLPAPAIFLRSDGPVDKPTSSISTGEQATSDGRQLSYAEISAAYTEVVAG
jgi:hypothetical protein